MNLQRMVRKLAAILGMGTVFLSHSAIADASGKPLMEWAVRVSQETVSVGNLPEGVRCSFRPISGLPGFFVLDFKNAENSVPEVEAWLSDHPEIFWFERQREDQLGRPNAMVGNPVANPRFGNSWHLANTGRTRGRRGEDLNVLPAWDAGYTGAGVLVAVVDEGTELTHPDLVENIRHDLSLDLVNPASPFKNLGNDEAHGTAVSGVIAARDNTIGGVGVAYGSHLVPIRYLGKRQTDATIAQALTHRGALISIFNNSWGPTLGDEKSDKVAMLGPSTLGSMALREGVVRGRAGRGSIFVFSAGNGATRGSNTNYNGWTNARETIAVGAVGNQGRHASYSDPGAALLVVAPSGGQTLGIFTTDNTGVSGYDPSDYSSSFSGTSASAPMVSGVVALMLESNPLLGWRDVQHILAHTAVKVDPDHAQWELNGAGLAVNPFYGFGRVDASSAVQAAKRWQNVGREVSVTHTQAVGSAIPNNTGALLSRTLRVSRSLKLEHVQVKIESSHSDWGDLSIVLISPSGTRSVLAEPHDNEIGRYREWTYSSVRHWDENATGDWTLEVADLGDEGTGQLTRWTLTLYGTDPDPFRNQVPIAQDDEIMTAVYPAVIPVLLNDRDSDGDLFWIASLYPAQHGDLSITVNQEILYTPGPGFEGEDRFGYSVSDGRGGFADATVRVKHPGPIAVSDQVVIAQGGVVEIAVLENDYSRTHSRLSLLSVGPAQAGTTSLSGTESVFYQSEPGFVGLDPFTYRIQDDAGNQSSGLVRVFVSQDEDFGLLFDGHDDRVVVAASEALNLTSALTIEAKIYLNSYGEFGMPGFGRILDKNSFSLFTNGKEHARYPDRSLVLALVLPDGSLATANSPENTIHLNRWHHVAASYDGTRVRIWIDGREVEAQNLFEAPSGPIQSSSASPLIMGEAANGERALAGILDWVRLWNRALPASMMGNTNSLVPEGDRGGLVGWWEFNSGVGRVSRDSNGNAHPGIIEGALWVPKDPSLLHLTF